MTIIMASHFPDHAFLVANKAAVLNNGRIAFFGLPDDVITEENMRITYGVNVQIVSTGEKRKACLPELEG
jgi:iron complex transport system ATP-binding protein